MKIALLYNTSKEQALVCAKNVVKKLIELNIEVLMCKDVKHLFTEFYTIKYFNTVLNSVSESDIVCVIGGDGTIIHSAKFALKCSKPILGINLGKLGFLADIEPFDIEKLSLLSSGDFSIEQRNVLEVEVNSNDKSQNYLVINDAVIQKAYPTKMIDIDVFKDDVKINNYDCDGIIVSTPTGSTAYNLSSGGPIIYPTCECIAITPICPHSFNSRSIILNSKDKIKIGLNYKTNNDRIYLHLDGDTSVNLNEKSIISISNSNRKVEFIKIKDTNFFGILKKKIF